MEPSLPDDLQQAEAFLRSGVPEAAQPILIEHVRQNPASEQGWLLLSQAMTDPQKQADCLRMVLRINPENSAARSRLARLLPGEIPKPLALPSQPVEPQRPADSPSAPAAQEISSPPQPVQSPPPETIVPPFTEIEPELLGDLPELSLVLETVETSGSLPPEIARLRPPIPAAQKQHPAKPKRKANPWIAVVVLGLVLLCIALAVGGWFVWNSYQETVLYPTRVALMATVQVQRTLPATWTATSTPPDTPTPTITPTPLPTTTPTLPAPGPTAAFQMEAIQQQVADLRGLEIQGDVSPHVVSGMIVEQVLTASLIDTDYEAELRDQAQVLEILGLIKPTYDIVKYTLNGFVDNIGGVYLPWSKQIFILGLQFKGIEHFVYSHEFDHALVDQHYHIDEMGVYPRCLSNASRCDAIQALVEGDATLLMIQWWEQYATPQDYKDIKNYRPPLLALPEEFPPPFVGKDVNFPYEQGYLFVEYLYKQGNWARVNQAYSDPPASTEHILHPEKYVQHEAPVEVVDPPLAESLGADWRELKRDVFGEWTTYLILGYASDLAAQQEDAEAAKAAAGWGGDTYQAYGNDSSGGTVLAAHWVWDTPADASQFQRVMQDYLRERYRGSQVPRVGGSCWQATGQTSCLFSRGLGTLWLIAPDQGTIELVLSQYPDFR